MRSEPARNADWNKLTALRTVAGLRATCTDAVWVERVDHLLDGDSDEVVGPQWHAGDRAEQARHAGHWEAVLGQDGRSYAAALADAPPAALPRLGDLVPGWDAEPVPDWCPVSKPHQGASSIRQRDAARLGQLCPLIVRSNRVMTVHG